MTDPTRCAPFIDALLDEGAPRPAGLAAHLEGCASCRALAAAHGAAVRLASPAAEPPPPVGVEEVLHRVRRRRAVRAGATGALAASLVAVVIGLGPAARHAPRRPGGDLFALADDLGALARRDPISGDPALAGLGSVAQWLAPPRARALDLDSITSPRDVATTGGTTP
jgi:hypothetical protein